MYLNDPAAGPRSVTLEEFDRSYTGVMMPSARPRFQERRRKAKRSAKPRWRLKRLSPDPFSQPYAQRCCSWRRVWRCLR